MGSRRRFISLAGLNINPCDSCDRCWKEKIECVIDDDIEWIIRETFYTPFSKNTYRGEAKMKKKFLPILLTAMLIVTILWTTIVIYANLGNSQKTVGGGLVYVATLYGQTPQEWYQPEELDIVMIQEINATTIRCYASSRPLEGYIIKYGENFYQIQYSTLHWDAGPFGLNNGLLITVGSAGIVSGWVFLGFVALKRCKAK